MKSDTSISVMLLNIQSVRNKTDDLFIVLEHLNFPSLVLLTEHWLKPNEPLHIPGYFIKSKFCRADSQCGGTVLLVNESFGEKFTNFDKHNDWLIERHFEFSIVYSETMRCFVICIYRSPNGNICLFLERLEELLTKLPINHKIILAGDFNIDFEDKNNIFTLRLSNLLESFNCDMHVRSATRITELSSTTIDYIASNIQNVSCNVFDPKLSDHNAILAKFPIQCDFPKDGHRTGRIYSGRNFQNFRNRCENSDWTSALSHTDPLEAFHTTLARTVNITFPIRRLKTKRKCKKRWLSKGIRTSATNLRFLNSLRKAYSNSTMLQSYYSQYRKIYRAVIRAAKKCYYSKRLFNSNNKQRESWAIVGEITNRVGASSVVDISANILNDYYCTVANNLTVEIHPDMDPLTFLDNINISESLTMFHPTTPNEIKKTISSLRNINATNDDGISTRILESLPDNAITVLSDVINTSFRSGCFPACFKTSKVIPLYKGGDQSAPSNYRPISLQSTFSKLIESLVKHRILTHLNNCEILNKNQFGFQPNKNTTDAMFDFLANVFQGINGRELSVAVFCDLSKAFDCVDHEVLLRKLYAYGFRDKTLVWFKNYLCGRQQCVFLNGTFSSKRSVTCGVPQGSVLGPILFLLYINDLAELNISGHFTIFADDTTILWRSKNLEQLKENMTSDLYKIKQWCDANHLCLNMSKTQLLGFNCTIDDLVIGNNAVCTVDNSRFLGLFIDDKLKFYPHIVKLSGKLASGCFSVRATFRELGVEVARDVYFALVESHLRYALPFWGGCSQHLFQTVFTLQRRAVRSLCGAHPRTHCKPLFIRHKILTLPALFILETACLIHKNKHHFPRHQRLHVTRQANDIPLTVPHSTLVKNSFIYRGVKIYNHIDLQIRNVQCLKLFRKTLKTQLLAEGYYSIDEFFEET